MNPKGVKVLVACEESQAVTIEFRKMGFDAYSCDIMPCSGGRPEWHFEQDVRQLLGNPWHLVIAFPPCTDLAVSGAAHFEVKRADGRQRAAIEFFKLFLDAKCDRVAIENPIGVIGGGYTGQHFPDLAQGLRPKDQIIQPYEYGDPYKKSTCLWLKGLPKLQPTNVVEPIYIEYNSKKNKSGKSKYSFMGAMSSGNNPEVARIRSKTPEGVAKAMADQWGNFILNTIDLF